MLYVSHMKFPKEDCQYRSPFHNNQYLSNGQLESVRQDTWGESQSPSIPLRSVSVSSFIGMLCGLSRCVFVVYYESIKRELER
jgi:hypothetical protein